MATNKHSAEQRIERSHLAIMKHPSFCAWSGLLFVGDWKIDDKCPTAYVNASGDTRYGRQFIESQPKVGNADVHVNYITLHENGHKALLHLIRGKQMFKENPMIANIAADHVVNNMIEEADPTGAFAKMPLDEDGKPMGHCDHKFRGKSLKEVYTELMKEAKQQGGGGGKGKTKTKGFDEHDPKGSGQGTGEDGDGDGEGGGGRELTDEEAKALEEAIEQALRNGSYLAGKQGGNAKRLVGDVLDAKIDWREQLAEFIMEACQGEDEATWRRPLRRFVGEDIYLPSSYQETVGKIFCGIDVSGSVGDKEMNACLGEVVEMCRVMRPSELVLCYWDDGITQMENYKPDQYDDIVRLTRPKGGGGTDVGDVAKYVNKHADEFQCAIILTDGYIGGGWRTWNVPVLWVLTTKNMVANCGKSLYIEVDY